mgnify:CR=1 FL=1
MTMIWIGLILSMLVGVVLIYFASFGVFWVISTIGEKRDLKKRNKLHISEIDKAGSDE